eukprot:1157213-Pelagomonas_calceolata.AAC.9
MVQGNAYTYMFSLPLQVSHILPYSAPAWEAATQAALRTGFLWHLPIQHLAYITAALAAASHPCSHAFVAELLGVTNARLSALVSWQQLQQQGDRREQGRRAGGLGAGAGGGKGMVWGVVPPMKRFQAAKQQGKGAQGRGLSSHTGMGSVRQQRVAGGGRRASMVNTDTGGLRATVGGRRGSSGVEWFVDERHQGLRRLRGTLKARGGARLMALGKESGRVSRSSRAGENTGETPFLDRERVGPLTLRSAGVLASAATRLCVAVSTTGAVEHFGHPTQSTARVAAAEEGGSDERVSARMKPGEHRSAGGAGRSSASEIGGGWEGSGRSGVDGHHRLNHLHLMGDEQAEVLPELLQQLQMLLRAWLKCSAPDVARRGWVHRAAAFAASFYSSMLTFAKM